MPQHLLPLFPLQVVLFPRTPLPLHIFEERYKEMMAEVIEIRGEFGVVLAAEKGICNTGCTAIVDKVLERYPDGRLDLLAIGRRRFEIVSLDDEKSFLRGTVEYYDDEAFEPVPPDVQRRVLEGFENLQKVSDDSFEPEMNDPQLSFQLAQPVTDLNFRQTLLNARSELDRMKRLAEYFPPYSARLRQAQHVRSVAPRNGHAKWPPTA